MNLTKTSFNELNERDKKAIENFLIFQKLSCGKNKQK